MRFARAYVLAFLSLLLAFTVFGRQSATTAERDPQAVVLVQQSIAAMGQPVPSDSTATGTVTIVAGSLTSHGTVRILTRSTTQTSIQFQTTTGDWSIIYSNGQANRLDPSGTMVLSLELAASSQCIYFPQPYISGLLSNSDFSIKFLGQEMIGSSPANHIFVQNTFASSPAFQSLSEFNTADIWLDGTNALPLKIAMTRSDGRGAAPQIPISFTYSNYQTISGVRYPFTIQEYVTETLWATTSIQSVNFNTGLTDANFPLIHGGN